MLFSPTCFFRLIDFYYSAWWKLCFSLVFKGGGSSALPSPVQRVQLIEFPTESSVQDGQTAAFAWISIPRQTPPLQTLLRPSHGYRP